jgi:hypothetical protein
MTENNGYIPGESSLVDYLINNYGAEIDDIVENNDYKQGKNPLVDYLLNQYGAEIISIEDSPDKQPPFPCLTGAANTTNSYKIDKKLYPDILAVGVDTLELNFGVDRYINPYEFQKLSDAKLQAVSGGYKSRKGFPVDWFNKEFMIQSHGSKGGYEYVINNGDIEIQIMPDAKGGNPSPEIRIIFRSPYLWRLGDIQAYKEVIEFLNEWIYLEYCTVSRADLCVDKIMPLPDINRKSQVVTRLRDKDIYYGGDYKRGIRNTGYHFGRGGIACRFYDKTYEIAIKGHGHIKPLWIQNGWDGESPVSRLELQLRREGLRRFDGVMDFGIFQDSKADIWNYGTDRFLRIVNPATSTRRERAKVMDYWKTFQDCSALFGVRQGVIPHKQVNDDWRPLVKQAKGCLASAYARLCADIDDSKARLLLIDSWGKGIPEDIIEQGMIQKVRFGHLSI